MGAKRLRNITPEQWRALGSDLVLREGRIFTVDLEANTAGPRKTPLLALHGFPSSSWDFADAASVIAERHRIVLFDFLGFGLSDKPADAGYSLFEQADVATAVARKAKLSRLHLWAHDMGTSVATELLARRERGLLPFDIASVTLMNGSVHVGMASLTVGQKILGSPAGNVFARFAGRRVFGAQMKRIFARPVSEEVIDGMWALLSRADGRLRLPKIIRYLEERVRFQRRWIGALERLDLPILIAWGVEDPVARIEIGERLAKETPGAELLRWEGLGHYPQMEDASRVAADIDRFVARFDR